ncbi:MAG TPA: CDP-alcohol phosphatidyltransferase family protein [Bryobacteraceae bacterium]|nr:CDP-alcohol phosphatidyltransferase family protein [Bryobacteraceae bacterium]
MKLIPNLLSASRLALAPWVYWLLWRREYGIALAVCFYAGISDALDGLLARRMSAASRFGAYLDPVADKIYLGGAFLTLALDQKLQLWFAILVLSRDVLILLFAVSAFAFTSVRDFPPSVWGKLSTSAQIAFMLVLLLQLNGIPVGPLVTIMLWITSILTAWSAVHYAWIGRLMMKV